jgi:hypothetical protein
MHVELWPRVKDRALDASHELDKSVSDIINTVVDSVDYAEITQIVKLYFKPPPPSESGKIPSKPKMIRRVTHWRIRL